MEVEADWFVSVPSTSFTPVQLVAIRKVHAPFARMSVSELRRVLGEAARVVMQTLVTHRGKSGRFPRHNLAVSFTMAASPWTYQQVVVNVGRFLDPGPDLFLGCAPRGVGRLESGLMVKRAGTAP